MEILRGYPTDPTLRDEWLRFDTEIYALRRPREFIRVFFRDSDVPVTVSKDKTSGGPAKITTEEAEVQLTCRYGKETKVYIVVGGSSPGRPLLWGPPRDMNLVELAKKFVIMCSQNDEINRV